MTVNYAQIAGQQQVFTACIHIGGSPCIICESLWTDNEARAPCVTLALFFSDFFVISFFIECPALFPSFFFFIHFSRFFHFQNDFSRCCSRFPPYAHASKHTTPPPAHFSSAIDFGQFRLRPISTSANLWMVNFWTTKCGASKGWRPRRVEPRRVGAQNFAHFFPSSATIFSFSFFLLGSLRGILVVSLNRRVSKMCTFGVLGLSCESPRRPLCPSQTATSEDLGGWLHQCEFLSICTEMKCSRTNSQ